MPRHKKIDPEVTHVADASSALYKDRSGQKLGGGHEEGKSYMGTIAADAIASVRAAQEAAALEAE